MSHTRDLHRHHAAGSDRLPGRHDHASVRPSLEHRDLLQFAQDARADEHAEEQNRPGRDQGANHVPDRLEPGAHDDAEVRRRRRWRERVARELHRHGTLVVRPAATASADDAATADQPRSTRPLGAAQIEAKNERIRPAQRAAAEPKGKAQRALWLIEWRSGLSPYLPLISDDPSDPSSEADPRSAATHEPLDRDPSPSTA